MAIKDGEVGVDSGINVLDALTILEELKKEGVNPTSGTEFFSMASVLKFNQLFVVRNSINKSERLNLGQAPFALGEFYGYGKIAELRGIQGVTIVNTGVGGNQYAINTHHVFKTASTFTHNSTVVFLNGVNVSAAFSPQFGGTARAWINNIDRSGNVRPYGLTNNLGADRFAYGVTASKRDFTWNFTDGTRNWSSEEYVDDANYFRLSFSGTFETDTVEETGTINVYILPNTGAGTGVTNTTGFAARLVVQKANELGNFETVANYTSQLLADTAGSTASVRYNNGMINILKNNQFDHSKIGIQVDRGNWYKFIVEGTKLGSGVFNVLQPITDKENITSRASFIAYY